MQKNCFRTQVLNFFTWDETLQCYSFCIISSIKLRWCCHVDIKANGRCVPRVGRSGSEGHAGTTGERGISETSPFRCHVNDTRKQ